MHRSRAGLVAVVLFVSVPCLAATIVPEQFADRPIASVSFRTNTSIDEEGLRALIPLRPGGMLTEAAAARSRELILLKEIYWSVNFDFSDAGDAVDVVIRVERKQVLRRVAVSGYKNLSGRDVQRTIRLNPGMVFDPESVDAAAERLSGRYRDLGFPRAQVGVVVEFLDGEVDLEFEVSENAAEIVSDVIVRAPSDVPLPDLARDLAKLRGQRFTRELRRNAEKTVRRKIREAGYLEARVGSEWIRHTDQAGTLRLDIEPGDPVVLEVRGNTVKDTDDLLGLINLEERLVVTDGTWRDLARKMQRAYQEDGYYRADVKAKIEEGLPKKVRFRIKEGLKYRIRRVEFEGNDSFASANLREVMITRPPRFFLWNWLPAFRSGVLLDDVLAEDVKDVRSYYRRRGFESVQVVDVRRRFDEQDRAIDLTVVVDEGPRSIVKELNLVNLDVLPEEARRVRLQPGGPFSKSALRADRRAFLKALSRLGYTEAKVETEVRREERDDQIDCFVTYRAEFGQPYRIGAVVVQGNIQARDRAVLREVGFKSGDPLSPEALITGQANSYRLGLFRSVSVRPLRGTNTQVRDVGVRVTERAPGLFEWGGGYNTRDGLSMFGEIRYDNLHGLARRVGLRGQASFDAVEFFPNQFLANLFYHDPRLMDSVWKLNTGLIAERSTREVDQFSVERFALVTTVDRPFPWKLQGGLETQIEYSDVFDVAKDAQLTNLDVGSLRTVALSPFLIYDARNDPILPVRGFFESVKLRYGVPGLSTVHFGKVSVQHSQYVPVVGGSTFVYSVRAGVGMPFDGSEFLPIRERFFLGGRNTVRGFAENSIGPQGEDKNPIGGDFALNLNTELRVPVYGGFGVAGFVDGGGVYLVERSIALNDFRRSAGLGLRYVTPVGLASLDYGIKLDRRGGESFGEVHFSIGANW